MHKTARILIIALAGLALSAGPALADDQGAERDGGPMLSARPMQPALLGSVTAISGTTLTVSARGQSITVDASSATVVRVPDTQITVGDIQVGDSVLVQGSLSGATLAATRIMDGLSTQLPPARPRVFFGGEDEHPPVVTDDQSNDQNDSEQGFDQNGENERPHLFNAPMGSSSTSTMPRREEGERRADASSTNPGQHLGWLIGLGNMFFNRHADQKQPAPQSVAFAVGGRIASIDGSAFTLEMPARDSQATSTFTVTTDASTTFMQVGTGPTTASALSVGLFASVRGAMTSTTSRIIAATRVEIASTTPSMRGPSQEDMQQLQEHMQQRGDQNGEGDQGTSTPVQHFFQRVFERFSNFFHF